MRRSDSAALLEQAVHQETQYGERSESSYQEALVAEAADELGADLASCKKWKSNRNADLYWMPTPKRTWLLKILTSKPIETLECEHASLTELDRIAREQGTFRVPEPGPLFEGRSAYVMEWVEGQPFHELLLERNLDAQAASEASRRSGVALGTIHREWSAGSFAMPVDDLVDDLAHLPFQPSSEESATLRHLADTLRGWDVPRSRLYLDFDPVNICLTPEGPPVLLDPPERRAVDAVHWDLGTYLFGIRRAGWRWPPAARRLASLHPTLRGAFLEGYQESSGVALPDELLLETGELFRLAQLWAWWMNPLGFRHRVVGLARSAYAYPLLRGARRDRFQAIRRLAGAGRGK